MSRSMMLLRIDFVLSAILASSSQRFVNSRRSWPRTALRFSRCFSWEGDRPSAIALRASTQRSRAISNEIPSLDP